MLATLAEDGLDAIHVLDQTLLPEHVVLRRLATLEDVACAIRTMQVRGAPLIGATAAYGVALALRRRQEEALPADDASLDEVLHHLAATRPTAVNLHWALTRMAQVLRPLPPEQRATVAWQEAGAIAAADAATNAAIGQHGLALLADVVRQRGCLRVMTHCNAGWLATVAHGTAIAPIYAAQQAGLDVHVWVSETRPRNQGWLTAWELQQAGVAHSLIADNAAGLLMMQGQVDLVIVGADRIAANGDTANKVGTYLKALAARAHAIPFYVAAPRSTIDFECPTGADIPIEERAATELASPLGAATAIANPAFDITPAALITGIITEDGVHLPQQLQG